MYLKLMICVYCDYTWIKEPGEHWTCPYCRNPPEVWPNDSRIKSTYRGEDQGILLVGNES